MNELRRKDRSILKRETQDLLERGEYGILSTVNEDGEPYGVPLNYCVIDHCIYFHCAHVGHKLNNIAANRSVSFCVVGQTQILPREFGTRYESVVAAGDIEEVFDEYKQAALEGLLNKYSSNYVNEGIEMIKKQTKNTRVFKIVINRLTGKARKK